MLVREVVEAIKLSLASFRICGKNGFMRNTLSLLVGGIALLLAVIAFLPLLGWANWVIIPMAVVGLAFGAMSDRTSGRNLNIVVIGVGLVRLWLGGGIF
jgi:hypothetical protein